MDAIPEGGNSRSLAPAGRLCGSLSRLAAYDAYRVFSISLRSQTETAASVRSRSFPTSLQRCSQEKPNLPTVEHLLLLLLLLSTETFNNITVWQQYRLRCASQRPPKGCATRQCMAHKQTHELSAGAWHSFITLQTQPWVLHALLSTGLRTINLASCMCNTNQTPQSLQGSGTKD